MYSFTGCDASACQPTHPVGNDQRQNEQYGESNADFERRQQPWGAGMVLVFGQEKKPAKQSDYYGCQQYKNDDFHELIIS